ncbi:protein translocase subunit SecD, partial [Alcaligenaceae bacterium 429]
MNRYPIWKYLTVLVALIIGVIYTLPNFYGESPAVQVASAKSTVKVDLSTLSRVESILQRHNLVSTGSYFEQHGTSGTIRVRFDSTDTQFRAKDIIERELVPDAADPEYTVALNLMPASPSWLTAIGAQPMHLGLDLRGGVHFLLEVDMQGALTGRYESLASEVRTALREADIPQKGVERQNLSLVVNFGSTEARSDAITALRRQIPDLQFVNGGQDGSIELIGTLSET